MSVKPEIQKGFSLLEVLIAIAILAGVAMAMGPAISAAARASSRIHQGAAIEEDMRAARQFFSDIILQGIILDKGSTEGALKGDASTLNLTTLDPGDMSPVNVKLTLTGETPGTLVAEFSSDESAEESGDPPTYILLSNISEARFEFLEDTQWRSTWREATPPALIRLTGVVSSGGESREFSFEAKPQAAAPLFCQFDPVSRRCR